MSSDYLSPIFWLYFLSRVNWQNDKDGGKTPLHACTTGSKEDYPGWKGIETAELLIQNGAKINATCLEDKTVLDTALLENADKELMEYLMARLGWVYQVHRREPMYV